MWVVEVEGPPSSNRRAYLKMDSSSANWGQIQLVSCNEGHVKIATTCREAGRYVIEVAEGVGFEPMVRLPVQQFSSPPGSIRSNSTASAHMEAPLGNYEAKYTSGRQQVIGERH